jgi:hypothetical protein
MKKIICSCVAVVSIALLVGVSCKLVEDEGESSQGVNALRLANSDVSPWTEISVDGFKDFKANNMVKEINGGAQTYVDKGMVAGFKQYMTGGGKSAELLVLDFGTEASTSAMYSYTDNANEDKSDAGGYPLTVAQLDNSPMSGVVAIAHFGKYYMELSFTGYNDKSEARSTAASFVEVFEEKISLLK